MCGGESERGPPCGCAAYICGYVGFESVRFAKESAFRHAENENTAVAAELSDRLGLCALLKKIDTVFCRHLKLRPHHDGGGGTYVLAFA